jgi:hypothetical protein
MNKSFKITLVIIATLLTAGCLGILVGWPYSILVGMACGVMGARIVSDIQFG